MISGLGRSTTFDYSSVERGSVSERRARDILKGRAMPHPKHRAAIEALARNC